MTVYFNANDGVFGRTGGPYLDVEQDKAEERRRATLENREPDFDNLPASAGTLLVPADVLVQRFNATHLDNQELRKFDGTIEAPVRATVDETSEEVVDASADGDADLSLDV